MRIYLDNCCFNRPYDDQGSLRIYLETQAKIHVQNMIKNGEVQLVTSYILRYENSQSPFLLKRAAIEKFLDNYSSLHIGAEYADEIIHKAKPIMTIGVKEKDALHVACALTAECEYFLTTDDRLIKKYCSDKILLVNPVDFIKLEENYNDLRNY